MAKSVVITGATRGLGRALCDRFAEAGWTVAGCGTNARLVQSIAKELGTPHRMQVVDTIDVKAVEAWAKDLISETGAPDLLINNAGVINENAPLWDVPTEEFERVMSVNVRGVFHVIRAFVPAMIERKAGVIVNLSSGWGAIDVAGRGTVLCQQVGDRGADEVALPGSSEGVGGGCAQPGDHRYRHASQHIRFGRRPLSIAGEVEPQRRPVSHWARQSQQWPVVDGSRRSDVTPR